MLEELAIKDYALIDRLSVEFESGFNVLSGETGAGKSIVIGALSFLLGVKTDPEVIRSGCEETQVSGSLRIALENHEALAWLDAHGIELDGGRILLRRALRSNGRGSIFIQDKPISRLELFEFSAYLFDLHGQHDQENLLKPENHRRYLDRFAGIEAESTAYNQCFNSLAENRRRLSEADATQRDKRLRSEMLEYAVAEIAKAAIKIGETENLEAEASKLSAFEKLSTAVGQAAEHLYETEQSAVAEFRRAKAQLDAAKEHDPALAVITDKVSELYYETEDVVEAVRRYRNQLHFDPERLDAIQERLALLFRLKKKYGADETAILLYRDQAESDLEKLKRSDLDRSALETVITALERDALRQAAELTIKRTAAAGTLALRISALLADLGMPKAQFTVAIQMKAAVDGARTLGPWGAEDIRFLISANPGEAVKDLVKVASGGELSRLMLAIKTILADVDTVETLVFDEIDAGIGGEVALAVGRHLQAIARSKQIFCITHLASIAVRADNHLMVEKKTVDGRTTTNIDRLTDDRRRTEIARMLAGDAVGSAALAHADDLLDRFGKRG